MKTSAFKTLTLFFFLLFLHSGPIYAQEEEVPEPDTPEEETAPVDDAINEGAEIAAKIGEGEFTSFGVKFQYWAPFTEVTSTLIGKVAGLTGTVSGTVTGTSDTEPEGENSEENLDVVSTDFITIYSVEYGGEYNVDNLHLDFTENTDFSRLNPFESRTDQSSKTENLKSSLTSEKIQSSRLFTQFNLLPIPDVFDLVFRFSEENFVSQVLPTKDTLFLSFSGSEALIETGTKIQLETSFEDKMSGITKFFIPGTEIPIGFFGYFELTFQKPIWLPLNETAIISNSDGSNSSVDAVIIFPQFSATGWMIESFKSTEEGFDLSGYLKFGFGNVSIGQSNERVNELFSLESTTDSLFSRSAEIFFSGGLLRLSYIGSILEFSFSEEWRVFTLLEEFNGIKSAEPLSVDLITSFELLFHF
ncbi:MAG: hypothetical protein HQM13_07795 [SAR324 cluster bacterium]|nr:hypothetical protein [SAR324 cluster bacterium]